MRITGDISTAEADVYKKVVHDAADELCFRVRICIEEGLGVDDLVGVVTGESTPQIFPRDYFKKRHCLAELTGEALAKPHPGQLPVVVLLREHEPLVVLWVWVNDLRGHGEPADGQPN